MDTITLSRLSLQFSNPILQLQFVNQQTSLLMDFRFTFQNLMFMRKLLFISGCIELMYFLIDNHQQFRLLGVMQGFLGSLLTFWVSQINQIRPINVFTFSMYLTSSVFYEYQMNKGTYITTGILMCLIFKIFASPILINDVVGIVGAMLWLIIKDFNQKEKEDAGAFLVLNVYGYIILRYQELKNQQQNFLQQEIFKEKNELQTQLNMEKYLIIQYNSQTGRIQPIEISESTIQLLKIKQTEDGINEVLNCINLTSEVKQEPNQNNHQSGGGGQDQEHKNETMKQYLQTKFHWLSTQTQKISQQNIGDLKELINFREKHETQYKSANQATIKLSVKIAGQISLGQPVIILVFQKNKHKRLYEIEKNINFALRTNQIKFFEKIYMKLINTIREDFQQKDMTPKMEKIQTDVLENINLIQFFFDFQQLYTKCEINIERRFFLFKEVLDFIRIFKKSIQCEIPKLQYEKLEQIHMNNDQAQICQVILGLVSDLLDADLQVNLNLRLIEREFVNTNIVFEFEIDKSYFQLKKLLNNFVHQSKIEVIKNVTRRLGSQQIQLQNYQAYVFDVYVNINDTNIEDVNQLNNLAFIPSQPNFDQV